MLIVVSLFLFIHIHVEAFLDWNLENLSASKNESHLQPYGHLILTPLLGEGKNWKKARKEAVVRPFAGKVKSFSGFFTVNEEYESNLFFWFFQSEKNTKKNPVILWLHGGPGQSSLMGLFEESGPYKIINGKATLRETSWTKYYNVLYLDNPVGAGYSYTRHSDGYSNTVDQAVDNIYEALTQFYKMFPEYKKNALYVVGQSYGGKYIPPLALKIHQESTNNAEKKINLKGMLIGCGCLDPENQIAFADFLYEFGVVDVVERNDIRDYEERAKNLLKMGSHYLAATQLAMIGLKMIKIGYKYPLDVSEPQLDLSSYDDVENFVTRDDVRKEIHVGDAEFHDRKTVFWYFRNDLLNSVSRQLAKILELDFKVLLYAGQYDMVIPHEQTDNVIENLDWKDVKNFEHAKFEKWYSNNELAGYKKSYANLTQVFVRKANHMIVRSQQKWMLDLLKSFISNTNS